MRRWVALGCVIAVLAVGSDDVAAEPARATLAASPAPTAVPRPPRLPAPRFLPRITIRIRPVYIPPAIALRPWRSLVGDLAHARVVNRNTLEIVVDLNEAVTAIRRLLRRDKYKRLMVDAMCTAMEWLRRQGPPDLTFSTEAWHEYLVGYLGYHWGSRLKRYSSRMRSRWSTAGSSRGR